MNAAEMKRAAGRALELGADGSADRPRGPGHTGGRGGGGVAVGEPHAPQPVYEPETFTQARWEELDDRGVLVDSLLEQYDGLEGMDLRRCRPCWGAPLYPEDPEVGMYRDGYYIGAGRENSGREEVMVLQFRDGEVIRVEFEDAG